MAGNKIYIKVLNQLTGDVHTPLAAAALHSQFLLAPIPGINVNPELEELLEKELQCDEESDVGFVNFKLILVNHLNNFFNFNPLNKLFPNDIVVIYHCRSIDTLLSLKSAIEEGAGNLCDPFDIIILSEPILKRRKRGKLKTLLLTNLKKNQYLPEPLIIHNIKSYLGGGKKQKEREKSKKRKKSKRKKSKRRKKAIKKRRTKSKKNKK